MRRSGLRWGRLVASLLLFAAAAWGLSLGAVVLTAHLDRARPAEAIVVLGAAQYDGKPSPVLRARLDHGVALWKRGLAPHFVLTGGSGEGDTWSEASAGRRYVLRRGVPDSAILLESRGRTTYESLAAVSVMMDGSPTRAVILVSDPFHMLRLAIVARRLGLVPYTSPTPTSPISANRRMNWKYYLGESVKAPMAIIQR